LIELTTLARHLTLATRSHAASHFSFLFLSFLPTQTSDTPRHDASSTMQHQLRQHNIYTIPHAALLDHPNSIDYDDRT
jgi:hypothetical protein